LSDHGPRPTFRSTMATSQDEEVDSTPLEGDRPGAHPVDVLDELPIDGESAAEAQLMTNAELDPRQVEGDRFDVNDDDLGMPPDLEDDPDAPDLQPDHVERLTASGMEEDPGFEEDDDLDDQVDARPTVEVAEDWVESGKPR
jgi:hypothetical protein